MFAATAVTAAATETSASAPKAPNIEVQCFVIPCYPLIRGVTANNIG